MSEPTSNPNREPYQQAYYPPRPTAFTRAMRTLWPWQLVRFIVINLKMLKLMAKSHH
ncbi:hypothetical protein GALL_356690 [mine drainage metagenome]|jgi:hypothetical protein|uniref:Uncharacterized protein n=1 Tax=mine drainage metagenome TaxID=410659 RepID=A0A1J5QRP2_9ZZZZ